jgi:hypothetical protein
MAEDVVYITIYRWAGISAVEEARAVRDLLIEAGFSPILIESTCEVQVPASESQQAEEVIADRRSAQPRLDRSEEADLVPIFSSQAANAEMEALAIKGILDASGIPNLLIEGPALPNLPHEVRVPKDRFEEAERAFAAARAAGPLAAEEGALRTQSPE